MTQFSETTFEWIGWADRINHTIDRTVPSFEQEIIKAEAMAARLTVFQAPVEKGFRQQGELVCPHIRKLISLKHKYFIVLLVPRAGFDLTAKEVVFRDDRSLADRVREAMENALLPGGHRG